MRENIPIFLEKVGFLGNEFSIIAACKYDIQTAVVVVVVVVVVAPASALALALALLLLLLLLLLLPLPLLLLLPLLQVAHNILSTGKYLNVIRQCGKQLNPL